jgi:hypothetical protein
MPTADEAARIMGLVSDYGHGCFLSDDGLRAMRWSQIEAAVTNGGTTERPEGTMSADTGATGVAEIMTLAHAYWSAPDEYVNAARSDLRAAVTKLVAERDEAERNVDLLSAALVDCIPATCDHTNRQQLARRRWYCMDCGAALPHGFTPSQATPFVILLCGVFL